MFLGLKEDISVKRTLSIVGFVALVTLGSLGAYADNCTKSLNGDFGTASTTYAPGGPVVTLPRLTTYCSTSYSNPLQSGPYPPSTPDRPSFIAATGQNYLDTINWEVNQVDNTNLNIYGGSPALFDGLPDGGDGGSFANPPYGGGVNGTGYSIGQVPSTAPYPSQGQNNLDLSIASQAGTMPAQQYNNLLVGTLSSGLGFATNWDTGTTGSTYNPSGTDSSNNPCYTGGAGGSGTPSNPQYDPDDACWTPGSNAVITGVGFDLQLDQTNADDSLNLGPWSATFAIYGATPGCNQGASAISQGGQTPDIQCYDYYDEQMTDPTGNDTTNDTDLSDCFPTGTDPSCPGYNAQNVQLLGYVTINSDSNGDPAFFGFTTNDPYGVGTIVLTDYSFAGSEGGDVNFAINQVTLLTQNNTTPEPTTLLLFGSGLLMAARRLRKKATIKA
jgi:hypothetical protein